MLMVRYRLVTCGILASVLAWTGPASAGWVIDEVVKGGGQGTGQQVMLQSNRIETLMVDANEQPNL
jgi:hypothetical protein